MHLLSPKQDGNDGPYPVHGAIKRTGDRSGCRIVGSEADGLQIPEAGERDAQPDYHGSS